VRSILHQLRHTIEEAQTKCDVTFFMQTLPACLKRELGLRAKRCEQTVHLPIDALILTANWARDWDGIPPLCMWTIPSLEQLFIELDTALRPQRAVGKLHEKTISRTLRLQRLKPAVVRSVTRKDKVLLIGGASFGHPPPLHPCLGPQVRICAYLGS